MDYLVGEFVLQGGREGGGRGREGGGGSESMHKQMNMSECEGVCGCDGCR